MLKQFFFEAVVLVTDPESQQSDKCRDHVTHFNDFDLEYQEPAWLGKDPDGKGVIPDSTVSALIGSSESGKSTVALDHLMCRASGYSKWLDHFEVDRGYVLYITPENFKQGDLFARNRRFNWYNNRVPIECFDDARKNVQKRFIHLNPHDWRLIGPETALRSIVQEIVAEHPRIFVCLDGLNRTSAGDESNEAMLQVIEECE